MKHIQTASGGVFDLLHPTPEMIRWEDVIQSLSKLCRFNGHCRDFYSVAEHSIAVARLLPPHMELYGLLHDAHEAYVGDVTTPLKQVLGRHFEKVEMRVDSAIYAKADIPYPSRAVQAAVRRADLRVLAAERRDLLVDQPYGWDDLANVEPDPRRIVAYSWYIAEDRYREALRGAALDLDS